MTEQEVLDFVVAKLREQGGPSMSVGGSCRYRGPNGRKCAAGWLMPDDRYHEGLEGLAVSNARLAHIFPSPTVKLLKALQCAHDWKSGDSTVTDSEWLAGFEREAADVAAAHGLIYPVAK